MMEVQVLVFQSPEIPSARNEMLIKHFVVALERGNPDVNSMQRGVEG